MYKDISSSSSFYHFAGGGFHRIMQNEDTLETTYDPYKSTRAFIKSVYPSKKILSKHRKPESVFGTCMNIYNSSEYDKFIRKQDPYIDK